MPITHRTETKIFTMAKATKINPKQVQDKSFTQQQTK
jgi:hypothetical protein